MLSDPICLRVKGPFACFTRPEFHVECVSYPVITPSAALGWACASQTMLTILYRT
jgi:CRISPR-associated protein Cas5d